MGKLTVVYNLYIPLNRLISLGLMQPVTNNNDTPTIEATDMGSTPKVTTAMTETKTVKTIGLPFHIAGRKGRLINKLFLPNFLRVRWIPPFLTTEVSLRIEV